LRSQADEVFEVDVNLLEHNVTLTTSEASRRIDLIAEPLNMFYKKFQAGLAELDIGLETLARPVEVPDPATPFADDSGHASYDADAVTKFWRTLVAVDRVLAEFGTRFAGKASRPGLWWGGLDYAAARWSGRSAPKHPGGMPNVANWVMEEGYSHEVAAYGYFAAGGPEGAFYAYTYPAPPAYRDQPVATGAEFSDELGEWLLPYHLVRASQNPEEYLLEFLQTTYDAAATTAEWSEDLERTT